MVVTCIYKYANVVFVYVYLRMHEYCMVLDSFTVNSISVLAVCLPYTYMYMYMCLFLCMLVCKYICMYVSIYLYIYLPIHMHAA